MPPQVSLIGVGPGDPGLLTLRAARAIAAADTVLYDALLHPAVLRHARPDAEMLFAGKRRGADSASQDEINHMLLYRARQGKRVARLKGGDPMVFGRGAEECEFLAAHGVSFEIVPGVTAALGATAYAGIPLSHRALSSSIAFVTSTERPDKPRSAHDWQGLATATQTMVLYMGLHRLADDMRALVEHGRDGDTPVAVIQSGTHPEQRVVVGTVRTIADEVATARLGSPALVVVGEVVSLRETLRWYDARPLFAKRVLVTRAKEQAGGFVERLLDEGAAPVEFPVLRFEAPTDGSRVVRAVGALSEGAYAAVAFTSANGVERFFLALDAQGLDARAFGRAKVVAIGPATAASLVARGVKPDATAKEFIGEAVADAIGALLGERVKGARVLIARAEVARDALPVQLTAMGASVDVVPVYRTEPAASSEVDTLREALREGRIDAVTFTSSSTVTHLCDALGDEAVTLLSRVTLASIGPITTKTARDRGLTVAVEARVFTTAGLVDALRDHYAHASESPRP